MKETVEQLKELLGADFNLLVDAFDNDNREHLAHIQSAIDDKDFEQLTHAAHSIKGASSNLGAIELASVCQKLESAGKEKDLSTAASDFEKAKGLFEQAVEILKAERS
ncbi:MAG: Hpt domain-containing protein [Gammaproteobacteria bacterium]|nr:Hpt domain-containing protein [Gammaproteobacteria bacterium]